MKTPAGILIVAVFLLAAAASPALAQTSRPERPYRGLFGGGGSSGDVEQSLVANVSLGGGYDDSLAADFTGREQPRPSDLNTSHSGSLANLSGALSYALNVKGVALGASAGGSTRYYPSIERPFMTRKNASLSVSTLVARGLSVNGSAVYAPYNLSSLYPGLFDANPEALSPPVGGDDLASSIEHYVAYSAGAGYTRQLSRRTSIDASYAHRARASSAGDQPFTNNSASGGLTHNVGRGLDLRAGYGYSQARYGGRDDRPAHHNIDAGVDFNRSLSFSRRTTVSFTTGTSAFAVPENGGTRLTFRASGGADLNHEMGRTWSVGAAYNRGVRFVEFWPEPVSTDAVSIGIGGLMTRRLQVQASARTASGQVGVTSSGGGFRTYQGSAGASYALSQHVSLAIGYSYYQHRFDQAAALAPGFTNHLSRNSVNASISVWAPIYQRARRTNAAR